MRTHGVVPEAVSGDPLQIDKRALRSYFTLGSRTREFPLEGVLQTVQTTRAGITLLTRDATDVRLTR
jgi:hypothetical protein